MISPKKLTGLVLRPSFILRHCPNRPREMRMRPILLSLLLCCGLTITACGQKGPLYLPAENAGQKSDPAKN